MSVKAIKLQPHQFIVWTAEFATGIVLRNDNNYYHSGDEWNDVYTIFEDLDTAKDYILQKVKKNLDIECYIKDHEGKLVFFVDQRGIHTV
ncbi:MAG: hypothetical protein BGO31_00735 [Bacteroidetes bacterium 43-16]|nr:MAG: hypothetical protein BGO31_00735 [Bacteroidetes bacterium 43-16]